MASSKAFLSITFAVVITHLCATTSGTLGNDPVALAAEGERRNGRAEDNQQLSGIPYANPHSCRKTLALLGRKSGQPRSSGVEPKLGHKKVLTTLYSYGELSGHPRVRAFVARGAPLTSVE